MKNSARGKSVNLLSPKNIMEDGAYAQSIWCLSPSHLLLLLLSLSPSLSLYLIIIAHSFVPSPISRSAVLLSPLPPSLQENEMALLHLNLEGFMTGLVVICVQISPIYFV